MLSLTRNKQASRDGCRPSALNELVRREGPTAPRCSAPCRHSGGLDERPPN